MSQNNNTIRVLVSWGGADTDTRSFPNLWLDPMPFVPRVNDLFSLADMFSEDDPRIINLTEQQQDEFYGLSYEVWCVVWKKDQLGYYVKLHLSGE